MKILSAWWADLRDGIVPLITKELRARSRGTRPVVLITPYLLALALGISGMIWLATNQGGALSPQTGVGMFTGLVVGFVLLLSFITPALTVGAVAGEREWKTLDLLLVTRASPLGIALGKLLSSVIYVIYLLLATIPAFALVFLFGGVPVAWVVMALVTAGTTAVSFAALGLLLSALIRRTQVASVVTYILVLAMVFGIPVLGLIQQEASRRSEPGPAAAGPPPWYLSASPLVAVGSAFSGPTGQGLPILGELLRELTGGGGPVRAYAATSSLAAVPTRQVYVVRPPQGPGERPETVEGLAPWIQHLIISSGLAALAVAGAALRLGGSGNLRALLRRRRGAPART